MSCGEISGRAPVAPGIARPRAAAVLFDMDGLLLDTERIILTCFNAARAHFDLEPDTASFVACVGLRADLGAPIVKRSLASRVELNRFNAEWDRRISREFRKPVPLRPGAVRLVRLLADQGMAMGVATSTKTAMARSHLERCGLLGFFAHVVGGDQVERPKPAPDPYVELSRRLLVNPRDCVVFEDSDVGVRAGLAAGAVTVQVPDLVDPSSQTRALGHIIAPSLLTGAAVVGLIDQVDASTA